MSVAGVLFMVASVVIILGAVLFGQARSGPQNTLGGVIALFGLVIASIAALALVAGI